MYVWTITTRQSTFEILQDVLNGTLTLKGACDKFRRIHIGCHPKLRRVLARGLRFSYHNTCIESKWFMTELLAAIDFAFKRPECGRLQYLTNALDACSKKDEVDVCSYYANRFLEAPSWFILRAMCCDCYTAASILSDESPLCILYAGLKHVEEVCACLKACGWCESRDSEQRKVFGLWVSEASKHVHCTRLFFQKGRSVLMFGEYHDETRMEFSNQIIEFLNTVCRLPNRKLSFFVELHPSNGMDTVQKNLSCDRTDSVAIHKVRCNPIITSVPCDYLKVIPIDTRHVDLGFVRFEMFEIREERFQKLVKSFLKESKRQLRHFMLERAMSSFERL